YRAALQAQRDVAHAFAEAAAPLDPEWQALAATGPERWSASGGFGPLRAEDRLIATADEPDAGAPGSGWMRVNDGFGAEPWRGPWCPDPAADNATLLALPGAFWHSGIAGRRREGTLQTATFELRERYLHVRAAGVHSRIVVIVDGFHVVRDPIYGDLHRTVDDPGAHWLTFDLDDYRGHSVFVQCIDQVAHDLGDPVHERGSSWPDDGWLAVQAVVASALAEPPPADPGLALPQLPWTDTPAAVRSALDRLATAAAALPAPSATLPALSDGSGRDEFLYIRGNHRTKGPLQHRRFLTALAGDEAMPIDRGSGRLQLAAAILAPDNPLPSRTLVNRVWHHLFGRGLVRSVDNLGVLGDPPTHPALLDWLARDFVAHGWSLKHVIRRVVRSDTYRQSSRQTAAGEAIDPANRLIHRQNVRRLEAEAVRDTLLAVSGRLDPTLYGPSVPIALDNLEHARGKPKRSGPVDGEGRRSIYLAIRRNFMPAMLWAFDLPTPFAPVGRRSVSNVPAQALTLLNDPFVHEMCTRWAAGLLADRGADDDAALVQRAWLTALARQPRVDELEQCSAFLAAAAFEYDCEDDPSDPRPFADLLHGLVNTKEFTFRR
ncbi:MAG: DUF1553 domain-containing protein, partial [Planctomycetes bacterium]|nr:DUF1553 domain-containing protein [Planctomycetota bacterium]